jgi:chorismate-pyruvate lyase
MLSDPCTLPQSSEQQLDLLMPLAFFYGRLGVDLPVLEFVDPTTIPEPQHHLLVHQSDMTPRLREHHRHAPELTVVTVERTGDYVLREVVLTCEGKPVEYGAIGIHLEGFPAHVRKMIREGSAPLGSILETEGIPHVSAPRGYFALEVDQHMSGLLHAVPGRRLYGRCNVLSHPDGTAFADIVEVLPPV